MHSELKADYRSTHHRKLAQKGSVPYQTVQNVGKKRGNVFLQTLPVSDEFVSESYTI